MALFKCFKEKTVIILEDDSEDFEEGTTLLVHKSLINLQSLLVSMTKDPLHISSWSRVVSCKLTNIRNSKLNKVKPIYDVLLLNSSHLTTSEVHDEFGLLGSCVRDGEAKWEAHSKYLGNLSLPKDIGNGLRRYWVGMDHFLKDVSFMKLFLHPYSAMIVMPL